MAVVRKNRVTIYRQVRNKLGDPKGRWLTTTVLDDAIYDCIKEVSGECKFEKISLTIKGNDYVTALGTSPRFFQLPEDFMCFDQDNGVMTNGIRRLGTTGHEIDSFQPKALTNSLLNNSMSSTITPLDYFTESSNGIIYHYILDGVFNKIIDNTGATIYENDDSAVTGNLLWLMPDPSDDDDITMSYIRIPDGLTTDGAYTKIPVIFDEVLVLGTAKRVAWFGENGGWCVPGTVNRLTLETDNMMSKITKMMTNSTPDKEIKIKSARQRDGRYNSGIYRGRGHSSGQY